MFLITLIFFDVGENMKGWVTASSWCLVYIIKLASTLWADTLDVAWQLIFPLTVNYLAAKQTDQSGGHYKTTSTNGEKKKKKKRASTANDRL